MAENNILIEPWTLGIEERKRIFREAKEKGKKIALYYDKELDVSTFRKRYFLSEMRWK